MTAFDPVEIFQTSTMAALLDGVYEGNVSIRELLRHGDFGLGTFNILDGEMLRRCVPSTARRRQRDDRRA